MVARLMRMAMGASLVLLVAWLSLVRTMGARHPTWVRP